MSWTTQSPRVRGIAMGPGATVKLASPTANTRSAIPGLDTVIAVGPNGISGNATTTWGFIDRSARSRRRTACAATVTAALVVPELNVTSYVSPTCSAGLMSEMLEPAQATLGRTDAGGGGAFSQPQPACTLSGTSATVARPAPITKS
jgi:hypothetical protein